MKALLLTSGLMALAMATIAQPYLGPGSCKHGRKGQYRMGGGSASNVDVLHYDITVDTLNFTTHLLGGHTSVVFSAASPGLTQLVLSLEGPVTDSVTHSSGTLVFAHAGNVLTIDLPAAMNMGQTDTVHIHYRGQPAQDPSGWGGFYWNGYYAFNLGVGFEVDPHVYGRAWFPCNDVFTDRSTYAFHIKAPSGSSAFCNGLRDSVQTLPWGASIHHWHIDQTMPTYLACMAVAPYHWLERQYDGISTVWACLPADTNAVLGTFANMPTAVQTFTDHFGPYRWPRIGYSLVPFNSGAMEHASSIHIGKPFVNGSLDYETLWAHELSHMWWGDLVTCETAEDMWLNEGFAVYAEALFTEAMYGTDAYKSFIRNNHRKVLQFTHIPDNDGAYYAMNQVPHAVTYGSTVYEKGPGVAHTLRGFMGDSLYFVGCRKYMDSLAFGNATSYDLRDVMQAATGVDLQGFFDGWVFQPGFPHFEVDSFAVSDEVPGQYLVSIYLRQKSRGNSHVYDARVPVQLINGSQQQTFWLPISTPTVSHQVVVDFNPTWVTIDRDEKMSDAVADREKVISGTGITTFENTNVSIRVDAMPTGPSTIRVSDHFVSPDPNNGPVYGHTINPYHYWTLEGELAPGFIGKAKFKYDGTTSTTSGYMDNDLITFDEDSLVMLYRPGPGHDWQIAPHQALNPGSLTTNKRGDIDVDTVQLGQYALAQRDYSSGIIRHDERSLMIGPNPTEGPFTLTWTEEALRVVVTDVEGRVVLSNPLMATYRTATLDLSGSAPGVYQVSLVSGMRTIQGKVAVR